VKVCLDTNVLVRAFATRGLSADVLRVVLAEHELLVPELILIEFRRALAKKLRAPEAEIVFAEQVLRTQTVIADAVALAAPRVRDAADARVLASAVAGGADVLVTGDADLLIVAARSPIPILSPRELWERLRGAP
jgi:putative PIN family toxin of toxin-antitoxin system